MDEIIEVSDEEVKSLALSILTRYGIDFTCYEPNSFRRRIVRILNLYNFKSIFELWAKFLHDKNFVYDFMNDISVGMTSMFRDPAMWKTLKNILRKKLAATDSIDIWHAGCSTGEEVYSMGIVLTETMLLSKAKAIATDINQEAIRIAQEGHYHKIKMIENERNYADYSGFGTINRYGTSDGKSVKMNSDLIRHVKFGYQNLIMDEPPAPKLFDIIFCRNVMIYFDNLAKERILDKFYNALKPDGILIIGFYDTMLPILKQHLFSYEDEEAKIFRKQAEAERAYLPTPSR